VAEPFDRQPDGGGVDDRQHLGDVLGEQPVEQHLVAVPQVRQIHPLTQIIRLRQVLGVGASRLPVQCGHTGGKQADQPELAALRLGERGAAVDGGGGQHGMATSVDPHGVAVGGRDEFVGSVGHDVLSRSSPLFAGRFVTGHVLAG
jgi:hypothetical protein